MSFRQQVKGISLCAVLIHLVPLALYTLPLPHHVLVPLPSLKMRMRTLPFPKTSQPASRHQRADSFGLTPFVEQRSEVKGQSPDPGSTTNKPEPVYAKVIKKTVKQEDPFGLSHFPTEVKQPPSSTTAHTASQRYSQSSSPHSPTATTRPSPRSNLDRSLDLFEPEPVHHGATKQTPGGDHQGVRYNYSSPWQQGADCFGAIPFVSMTTKDT